MKFKWSLTFNLFILLRFSAAMPQNMELIVDAMQKLVEKPDEKYVSSNGFMAWILMDVQPKPLPVSKFGAWDEGYCYIILKIQGRDLNYWCLTVPVGSTEDQVAAAYTLRFALRIQEKIRFSIEFSGQESEGFRVDFLRNLRTRLIVPKMFVLVIISDAVLIYETFADKDSFHTNSCVVTVGRRIYVSCGPLAKSPRLIRAAKEMCKQLSAEIKEKKCTAINATENTTDIDLMNFYELLMIPFKSPPTFKPLMMHFRDGSKFADLSLPHLTLSIIPSEIRVPFQQSQERYSSPGVLYKGMLKADSCVLLSVEYKNSFRKFYLWLGSGITKKKQIFCVRALTEELGCLGSLAINQVQKVLVMGQEAEVSEFKIHFADFY